MPRLVDKSKKKNRKCEYCKYFIIERDICKHPNSNRLIVKYWKTCNKFDWTDKKKYKE